MSIIIEVPAKEMFDEVHQEFINVPKTTLKLEHSLVSISKWESKWKKPFISKDPKTMEETIDYIKCMTISQNVDDMVYRCISNADIQRINDYIADPMTATWFAENTKKKQNTRIITSELIYYWMIALNIPVEFQKWHLNRLITLIQVCSEESNQENKKMTKREMLERNRSINNARKAALHTRG